MHKCKPNQILALLGAFFSFPKIFKIITMVGAMVVGKDLSCVISLWVSQCVKSLICPRLIHSAYPQIRQVGRLRLSITIAHLLN